MRYSVEELCKMAEGQTFDCKSVQVEPKALANTIVAMANADGGIIPIGISDKIRRIEGVDQDKVHFIRTPFDFCVPTVTVSSELLPCTDCEGRANHILIMRIPASPRLHANQADEVFFETPGKLPGIVRVDNIRHTHFSRNPKIAEYLKAYNYVKEFGEGVDRMCKELSAIGTVEPQFHVTAFIMKATIYSAVVGEEQIKNIPHDVPHEDLSAIIISLISENNKITRNQIARKVGLSIKTIGREIKKMPMIKYVGSGNNGHWEINTNVNKEKE